MAAEALIFDADGTLWDSFPLYAAAIANGDSSLRTKVTGDLRRGISIVALMREHGVTNHQFLERVIGEHHTTLLYPGVSAAIAALARREIPLGIATSLPGRIVEPLLLHCGLAERISVVVHAGNCRARKPNPGPILTALERLHRKPSTHVFYIGDRADDALAACRAGVSFAWAAYGYDRKQPPNCAAVLGDVSAILRL